MTTSQQTDGFDGCMGCLSLFLVVILSFWFITETHARLKRLEEINHLKPLTWRQIFLEEKNH